MIHFRSLLRAYQGRLEPLPPRSSGRGAAGWTIRGGTWVGTVGILLGIDAVKADGVEILIGGDLKFGVTTAEDERLSDGEGDRGYTLYADSELFIEADTSPSESVDFGAEIVIEADADQSGEPNVDQAFTFASGAFGRVELGRTDGAEDAMAVGADTIAAGTGGIDGDAENLGITQVTNSDDAAKISYFTPRVSGLQFGASYTPDTSDGEGVVGGGDTERPDLEDHVGVGLNFLQEAEDLELVVAAVGSFGSGAPAESGDLSAFSLGTTLVIDEIEIGASYGRNDDGDDFDFATLGVTVGLGDIHAGVGYNYLDEKSNGITHVVVLSSDLALLRGVELQGDVSYAAPEDQQSNIASVIAVELVF